MLPRVQEVHFRLGFCANQAAVAGDPVAAVISSSRLWWRTRLRLAWGPAAAGISIYLCASQALAAGSRVAAVTSSIRLC